MTQNIAGKIVVITGASSGLGEAVARRLVAEGAKIVIGARRMDRLEALADALGLDCKAIVKTDVSKADQVQALVDQAISLYGRVDALINNAGLMPSSPLEKRDIAAWDAMIDINLKGTLYGIAAVLPQMQRQKSGHIINVASVAGHKVGLGGAVYSATKTAVRVLSEGLRQEVKAYNIRTTIISPGAVATELTGSVTDAETAQRVKAFYEQVAIPPESFADTVINGTSTPMWGRDSAAPLCTDRRIVETLFNELAARAKALGFVDNLVPHNLTPDPQIRIVLEDGSSLTPARVNGTRFVFRIPANTSRVWIASRHSRPCDIEGPFVDDRRKLGVSVGSISLFTAQGLCSIDTHMDEFSLEGWHPRESEVGRWTDGYAELPLTTVDNSEPAILSLEIFSQAHYLEQPEEIIV